jgi:hypothetical protein
LASLTLSYKKTKLWFVRNSRNKHSHFWVWARRKRARAHTQK